MILDIEPYYLDSASLEKERLPGFVQCPHVGPFPSDAETDRSTLSAPLRTLLAPLAIVNDRALDGVDPPPRESMWPGPNFYTSAATAALVAGAQHLGWLPVWHPELWNAVKLS